jgi:hypothetical protein
MGESLRGVCGELTPLNFWLTLLLEIPETDMLMYLDVKLSRLNPVVSEHVRFHKQDLIIRSLMKRHLVVVAGVASRSIAGLSKTYRTRTRRE